MPRAGAELAAVAQWLLKAQLQHEAPLARALAAAPQLYFVAPLHREPPLLPAAAHGAGGGRSLTGPEIAARRPDGYLVSRSAVQLHAWQGSPIAWLIPTI